jgi:hypothetical protein
MSRMRRTAEQPLSLFSFQDIITSVTGVMVLLTLLLAVELMQRVLNSAPKQTEVQITSSVQSIAEMQAELAELQRQLDSSGAISEKLPSFDVEKLRQDRQQLQVSNQRLQQEVANLSNRNDQKQVHLAKAAAQSIAAQQTNLQEIQTLEQQIADAQNKMDGMTSSNRIFFNKDAGGKRTWIVESAKDQLWAAEIGVSAPPRIFAGVDDFRVWVSAMDPRSAALYLIVKPDGEGLFESCRDIASKAGVDIGFHVMAANQQVIDSNTGAATP